MKKKQLLSVNDNIAIVTQEIQTDIFNGSTPEFFINMNPKDIPPKGHPDRGDFIRREKEKCRTGVNIGGVWIPGNLYFHLNYLKIISDDEVDSSGKTLSTAKNAELRDNDWIIHNEYAEAVKQHKGYCLASSRQLGKTTCLVSLALREVSLFENSEAMVIFGNDKDKQSFTKKIRVAIQYGEPFIIVPPIDKDWAKKTEIRFGYTNKDNSTVERSRMYIYNSIDGNDTEVGAGKALKHGSKVYYADREGVIEDCKVGDKIFGRDGKLTTITGVYPQGIVDLYKITFADGREIECCGEHLWEVEKIDVKPNEIRTVVLNTKHLFDTYKRKYFDKNLNKEVEVNRYTILKNDCLEYSEKPVEIDPYYLGIWLAEGTTNSVGHITTADSEIVDFLKEYADRLGGRLILKKDITYGICNKESGKKSPLFDKFKKYNLIKNKHIPNDYLYNTKEIRMELLKAILDGDGTVDKKGRIELALSCEPLVKDVVKLIRSLGFSCSVTSRIPFYLKDGKRIYGKTSYRIYMGKIEEEVFKLSRKKERQFLRENKKFGFINKTTIVKIEKVKPDYATCISVNNKDKLFLTTDYIPTHNTVSFFAMDEALKHGSKVYYKTHTGNIEDVKIGDRIYGQDGNLTTVVEVHPQGVTEIYKLTLMDGRTIETSPNHLWDVYDVGTKSYKILTTEQMFKTNNLKQIDNRYNKTVKKQRYFLPKNEALNYPEKEVFIEPYYLGLWLGDGASKNVGNIAGIDEPVIQYLKEYAKKLGGELNSKTAKNHQIRFKGFQKKLNGSFPLRKLFDIYNLYDNKHIPEEYMTNSYGIRMEMLKGLMDSDGTVYKDGHIEFSNTNFKLISQVTQLVRSLGINCKLSEAKKAGYTDKEGVYKRCKDSYKLSIRTSIPIFKLQRKLDNYKITENLKKKSYETMTSIVSIERMEDDYSTCIKVDNQNSLFLTNDLIVTHNCGKYKFQPVWEAVEPALKGKFGYRNAPYFSWTGGDTQKAEQAFKFTLNPEASNLLAFETEGKATSKVMFAEYRQDCKVEIPFTDFLFNNNIAHDCDNAELKSLKILTSDREYAIKKTLQELEEKKKDKDPLAASKYRAYYPLCLKDILSKPSSSNFKREYISQQREYLKSNLSVTYMETKRDIHTKIPDLVLSNKKPITSYPKESWHDGDAPICVYDMPKYKGFGVHVIGVDCIREDEAQTSDSLGSFYVWRRNHNDLTDPFRDKMVVSYKGRLKTVKEFHEMILDVAEIYDAKILYEHSDRAFLDFFEGRNKSHLLIDAIPIQREINPKSKSSNTKGLRPTAQNKAVLYATTLGLVNEEMEDGNLGYCKILDDVLLQELDAFDPDLNMDCYIAFSHVAQARLFYDKYGVAVVTDSKKEIFTPPKKEIKITSAFGFNPHTTKKPKTAFGF